MIAKDIIELVIQKPNTVLGLATGETPIGIYKNLVKDYEINHTDYSKVHTFNLDEYIGLGEKDEQSYHAFMKKHLFEHVNLSSNHTHFPSQTGEAPLYPLFDDYEIDLQLLGLGVNGHIGFNEPGTPFDSETHKVLLSRETIHANSRFFKDVELVPKQAITMGIKDIMRAKKIVLIATGKKKAEAVFQMILGPLDTKWPASILKTHPNVYVYLDEDAASLLTHVPKE
jgi:glucosamine-6-phosphate deaminase